ncbi:hypothetical protein [Maribellus maritimus]|uniref:hypothetical protein n=1 Tax=Maribellus maritimus TaxID=2870838 RepID=UPI001EEAD1AA|nr:hypothetical protein [Maribellus maritimus]MCG6190464.1 hypothetical protein [Maribellus maritimus]
MTPIKAGFTSFRLSVPIPTSSKTRIETNLEVQGIEKEYRSKDIQLTIWYIRLQTGKRFEQKQVKNKGAKQKVE